MLRLTAKKVVVSAALCFTVLAILQIGWLISAYDSEISMYTHAKKQFESELQSVLNKNDSLKAGFKDFINYYIEHKTLGDAQHEWFYFHLVPQIDLAPQKDVFNVYLDGFSLVQIRKSSTTPVNTLLSTSYEQLNASQIKEAGKICINCMPGLGGELHDQHEYQLFLFYKQPWAGFFEKMGFLIIVCLILLIILGLLFYEIVKKYRQERKLSEAKNDFINNLSHEMQTPVFAIQMANRLIEEKTDDEVAPLTKIIEKEAGQLKQHAAKILELASLERGQVELHKEVIELNSLVAQRQPTIELMLSSRKGEVKINFANKELYTELDVVHFNNILVSLAENAIKYTNQLPKIKIDTGEIGKMVYLKISDNGIGIRKDYLPYVFDKFFRVPSVKRNGITGFGLGLSYVKHIVDLHNGEVRISSEEGKGTAVTILLPKSMAHV